ncbi:MAG TPA: N-acetylglucosamine kinase, partial [Chitinophagales bacterium]|nr:N-acetylglucosamine kinase [Chitinophagales bacterium]
MKLIADSGSTKTDWALIGEQAVLFTSSGLNPNILKDEEIVFALNNIKEFTDNKSNISEVFFYGAGC